MRIKLGNSSSSELSSLSDSKIELRLQDIIVHSILILDHLQWGKVHLLKCCTLYNFEVLVIHLFTSILC